MTTSITRKPERGTAKTTATQEADYNGLAIFRPDLTALALMDEMRFRFNGLEAMVWAINDGGLANFVDEMTTEQQGNYLYEVQRRIAELRLHFDAIVTKYEAEGMA